MDKLFLAAIKEETIGLDYFNHVGVGKINATYNTLKLINIYKPKLIINYGTAGAINTKLKGIVECTKFYQRDMDVRGLDFELGETPFDKIKEIITSKEGYSCGTGDSFVNKKIDIEGDVVEIFGENLSINEVARWGSTISYEVFTGISQRVPRVFVGE